MPLPKKELIEDSLKNILTSKVGGSRTLKMSSQVSMARESVDKIRNSSGSVFEGLDDESFEVGCGEAD